MKYNTTEYMILKQEYFSLRNREDFEVGRGRANAEKYVETIKQKEIEIYDKLSWREANQLFRSVNKMLDPHNNLKGREGIGAQKDEQGNPISRGKYYNP